MSHRYSGPDYGFPHGDARLDLTDLYAFADPGDIGKSILIMNVHPSAAVNPAGPTTDEPFATEAVYELKIDTNRDLIADIAYRVRFTSDKNGTQNATLRRIEGEQAAGTGDEEQTLIEGAPVSTAREASGKIGLWHRTVDGVSGQWVQADRGALASQSVFLPGDEKAAYQAGQPVDDARFIPVFAHSLEHTGGYTPEEAKQAAGILLPDILPYDPSKPASYPSNGRTLADDAIDVFLSILTNGKVTRDNVGPHTDLLTSFPYVGSPHKVRSAERVAA
jgi:hypothetical protein